jgi:hypothetical protein
MLCAVSFNRYGRLYYFDAGDLSPSVGDKVLVPTDDGPEVAECVWAPQWVDDAGDPPRLVGLAGPTTCAATSCCASARPRPRSPRRS